MKIGNALKHSAQHLRPGIRRRDLRTNTRDAGRV